MLIVGVDPSINKTGVAWYDGERWGAETLKTKGKTVEEKIWNLIFLADDYLYNLYHKFNIPKKNEKVIVIIEKPAGWTRQKRNIDSVIKLNMAYISLYFFFYSEKEYDVILQPAPTKRGGLPTKERARYILKGHLPNADLSKLDNNAVDALMLAVWGWNEYKGGDK